MSNPILALQDKADRLQSFEGRPESVLDRDHYRLFIDRHSLPDLPAIEAVLSIFNGWRLQYGHLLGIATGHDYTDMESTWNLIEGWRKRRWLPLASDGFGNYYVFMIDRGIVCFFECSMSFETPAFVLASNPYKFYEGFLDSELGVEKWPFDPDYMFLFDPPLKEIKDIPWPWTN